MDPYEYEDVLADVCEQLPRQLKLDVKLAIDGDDPCEPRVAIFTCRSDGREWRFPVQPNGRIAEEAVWFLCAAV
jgi:hypothetical protein